MNKATLRKRWSSFLVPGAIPDLGQSGGMTSLDDLWADCAPRGQNVLLSLIG